jgi:hypothetical protein
MSALAGIGIALGVANFINGTVRGEMSKSALQEIQGKLDALRAGQAYIIGRLKVILAEIKWTQVVAEASAAVQTIEYEFSQIPAIAGGDPAEAEKWATAALDANTGIAKQLFVLNQLLMGTSLLGSPLMQVYAQKLQATPTSQSEYWEAVEYFEAVQGLETQGLSVLANAFCYQNNTDDATQAMAPYNDWYSQQADYNRQFVDPLDKWYRNPAWGDACFDVHGDLHYVDTNESCAPAGQVVVGLGLYLKGNRVGLQILTATVAPGDPVELTPATAWQPSPGWGSAYFDLDDNHYVDTNETVVPAGHVVTGAALYLKGNRMAIKLQSAPLDSLGSAQWTDSPAWGESYFSTDGDDHYVNTNSVQPNPASLLTGAKLYLFGNRVAVAVQSAFETM